MNYSLGLVPGAWLLSPPAAGRPQSRAVCYLGVRTERADGRHSDEGEALVQVLVGGAALQESKGDKVELSLQNQDQLPVPADGAAGVHQALQRKSRR